MKLETPSQKSLYLKWKPKFLSFIRDDAKPQFMTPQVGYMALIVGNSCELIKSNNSKNLKVTNDTHTCVHTHTFTCPK